MDVSGEDTGHGAVAEVREPPRRPSRINYQTNQKYLGLNRTATERLNRVLAFDSAADCEIQWIALLVARSAQRPLPNEALSHTHTHTEHTFNV